MCSSMGLVETLMYNWQLFIPLQNFTSLSMYMPCFHLTMKLWILHWLSRIISGRSLEYFIHPWYLAASGELIFNFWPLIQLIVQQQVYEVILKLTGNTPLDWCPQKFWIDCTQFPEGLNFDSKTMSKLWDWWFILLFFLTSYITG